MPPACKTWKTGQLIKMHLSEHSPSDVRTPSSCRLYPKVRVRRTRNVWPQGSVGPLRWPWSAHLRRYRTTSPVDSKCNYPLRQRQELQSQRLRSLSTGAACQFEALETLSRYMSRCTRSPTANVPWRWQGHATQGTWHEPVRSVKSIVIFHSNSTANHSTAVHNKHTKFTHIENNKDVGWDGAVVSKHTH